MKKIIAKITLWLLEVKVIRDGGTATFDTWEKIHNLRKYIKSKRRIKH